MQMYHHDYRAEDLEVKVCELLVATSDGADPLISTRIQSVLHLVREKTNMDVVFVSEFTDGQRVFRHLSQKPGHEVLTVSASNPLEESWCQRVVDGRLPEFMADASPYIEGGQAPQPGIAIGTHISTPIVLKDGNVYGTLCCFSFEVNAGATKQDLKQLQYTANLVGMHIQSERDSAAMQLA